MRKAICVDLANNWHGIATGGGVGENIGLGYIAATLQNCGFEVEMYQPPLNHISYQEIRDRIISCDNCDIVAVSSMIYSASDGIKFAQEIRKNSSEIKLIVGGAGPSGWPELYVPYFDSVIVGEGEVGLLSWLGDRINGIKRIGRNNNWAGRPWPLRDEEVLHHTKMCGVSPLPYEKQVMAVVSYGRGCPNNCWFCSSPVIWQRKVCWRPVEDVADEVEFLHEKFGVNLIDFCDATFNVSQRRVLELCEEFSKRKLGKKVRFFAMGDPCRIKKASEMFFAMREAGFFKVAFGIEGATSEERRALGKSSDNMESCRQVLQAASDADLMIRAYLIIGTPSQKDEHLESMKRALLSWPIDEIRVSVFCPFPGTRAWQDLREKVVEKDLARYDANWPIIKHSLWKGDEILALRKEITSQFYMSRNYESRKNERIKRDFFYKIGYEQLERYLQKAGFIK